MSETKDIAERLRERAQIHRAFDNGHMAVDLESAADEIERLRAESARWTEIVSEELAETRKLMDAIGVFKEVEGGTAVMDAMLGKIGAMEGAIRVLAVVAVAATSDSEENYYTNIRRAMMKADENPIAAAAIKEAGGSRG